MYGSYQNDPAVKRITVVVNIATLIVIILALILQGRYGSILLALIFFLRLVYAALVPIFVFRPMARRAKIMDLDPFANLEGEISPGKILVQAGDLIRARKFTEARTLLLAIRHDPTAAAWLKRLEDPKYQ